MIYVAFDVLGARAGGDDADGDATVEPLLREPLEDRRRRLEALGLPLAGDGGVFALATSSAPTDGDALEDAFPAPASGATRA